ncbi:MAG: ecsC [Flaviaesturariibacter sp.]|nr:ecsC [Flaviaesturariibacter sp.]
MEYEQHVIKELRDWQAQMQKRPTLMGTLSRSVQQKLNSYIPEKVHKVITAAIRQMIKGVLFGAKHLTKEPMPIASLRQVEEEVIKKINTYKRTAAAEGGFTGAGGILLGLADFPILLGLKLKLLFDIATLYGFSVKDYKERLYLLHIFQLAFSGARHRKEVYSQMTGWKTRTQQLPENINDFDWRSFQQEYRDYIDLAKMAQLIPGIGAVVGYVVNYKLIEKLGRTAMNAYRMRWAEEHQLAM